MNVNNESSPGEVGHGTGSSQVQDESLYENGIENLSVLPCSPHPTYPTWEQFVALDGDARHQICTCKKAHCTCITPEPSVDSDDDKSDTDDVLNKFLFDLGDDNCIVPSHPPAHSPFSISNSRAQAAMGNSTLKTTPQVEKNSIGALNVASS